MQESLPDMMEREEYKETVNKNRDILSLFTQIANKPPDHISDQEAGVPMPAWTKEPMTGTAVSLPDPDRDLVSGDFYDVIDRRRTERRFSGEKITLKQLAFLLWCAQGIKRIPERSARSFRTVASGGGRHPFELYAAVRHVEDIDVGLYHYLPLTHEMEYIGDVADMEGFISDACSGQNWAAKASVVLFLCAVPYRTEWRYGAYAHPLILMDAGHVSENTYLAAASMGLGCCTVARLEPDRICEELGLDRDEEIPLLALTIGTIEQ